MVNLLDVAIGEFPMHLERNGGASHSHELRAARAVSALPVLCYAESRQLLWRMPNPYHHLARLKPIEWPVRIW